MRLRRRRSSRRTDRITLNLASMIDVTFLLLIYFMVTTAMEMDEDRLNPALQTQREAQAGPASDFQPQIVEVVMLDGEPAYRLGTRVLRDRQSLRDAMSPLPRDAGVFIRVYDNVSVGFATAAIQIARDVGFEQVTYVPAQ